MTKLSESLSFFKANHWISSIKCVSAVIATGLVCADIKANAVANEVIANEAKLITVLIEGAVSGSGFLVDRNDSIYTVLTSWHVIGPNQQGEEVSIRTWDGQHHRVINESKKQIRNLDLGFINFSSAKRYQLARLGSSKDAIEGSTTYISGYPLATEYNPYGVMRFLQGSLVANAKSSVIQGGFQLMYSNPTFPGMSGGPLFNSKGEVIGVHGLGETDPRLTSKYGIPIKTGINKAVPIGLLDATYIEQNTTDFGTKESDYFVRAWDLIFTTKKDYELAIDLLNKTGPETLPSQLYFARSIAYSKLGNIKSALADINKAITVDPSNPYYLGNRGIMYSKEGRHSNALYDYSQSLKLLPDQPAVLGNRAETYRKIKKFGY